MLVECPDIRLTARVNPWRKDSLVWPFSQSFGQHVTVTDIVTWSITTVDFVKNVSAHLFQVCVVDYCNRNRSV